MPADYDIDGIRAALRQCRQTAAATPQLAKLVAAIDSSVKRLSEPTQLAIIGKMSSSKSTLVNAILGKDELMSTGVKEVTFNVGWLRYGNAADDIIIHNKDGRPDRRERPAAFARLSADEKALDATQISYIEVFDDAPILRDINIIDTPGLNALRTVDSQNTLDFIGRVRPDAVVMLFTHAIAEDTLDVVRSFNMGAAFNPLNAIGILSKIDVLWQEAVPRTQSALQIGRKMVDKRKAKDATLRKTLFDLFPVSALLYMAATTVSEADIGQVRRAYEADPEGFVRAQASPRKFIDYDGGRHRALHDKIGLYGVWLITQRLKSGDGVSLDEVRRMFRRESGADDFAATLHNHFGSRARLIKIEGIYQHLHQTIARLRPALRDRSALGALAAIEQRMADVFGSMVHEHTEYEILRRLYDGKLELDAAAAEFRALAGEGGDDAPSRLRMTPGAAISDLLAAALAGERRWRGTVATEPDPAEREWMNVMLKSYARLRRDIANAALQYQRANAFLFKQQ